ncbi:unnamed protein product [Parnassius mnemosyne]|uniref:Calponin-homology (CH) domain-containing protein n=1 Tax=Parnassius mnemosyne TaxID=213953 RepID=A0AAV1LNS9_9NEOP
MYFQIENTPENIRRARRKEIVQKDSPKEACPRLILAPFSRPPQVLFENVVIGTSCERNLEIFNPSNQIQQIALGRSLPPGLVIDLPDDWLLLEPETCYCLTMIWTPMQPLSLRETIRFTNENRGRYDVIVVLKSVMNIKGKGGQPKTMKISPGKIKKKTKKSPVGFYKKKAEVVYNSTKIKTTVNIVQTTQHKSYKSSEKENISTLDHTVDTYPKCPFDSPTNIDFYFNTSEIFSNMRKPNNEILQNTYDKTFDMKSNNKPQSPIEKNILKPSNRQVNTSISDIFDNFNFTPLKTLPTKSDKLDKGPKIILSMNSESDFDDSLDIRNSNKENESHSLICITSSQPPNKWLTVSHSQQDNTCTENPAIPSKKIPNTSSPKELNNPNFSINTEFSRISDLSFCPQRFSTERKILPKMQNDTQELINDTNPNIKLSSDTYTKESPNTLIGHHQMDEQTRKIEQHPKLCRQSLFRDNQHYRDIFDKNYLNLNEHFMGYTDLRPERSPPRCLSPPLQSIPEESGQISDTQVLDKTDKQMTTFTINRTFDKTTDGNNFSALSRQSWSKKAVRAESDLWKVPILLTKKNMKGKGYVNKEKDSISGKISNTTFEGNKVKQNVSLNQVGNVYSQSFTVDPFLSSTYFYDEGAVDKFEQEFKRWLNYILTPPADLDSNIDQKIDVGKAWIENRNKEVPAAPTKEQVSSRYHNRHRLESLRRSARAMLMSSDMSQVFMKLNAQIEKKLIAIRNDRNLHLDVGLQKVIMELLLSYNPLWLRIGLEAIYGLVLPLKSNSDIEGLTTFIIQRMFKNPYLKNKHSKSSAPNMLLPAYMEAIKKFTLKKFFMLVFFLDQAKQKKLISHDPCLFCRNAVCKESREIIIRFTRELIAGIGDITKHLRPLGYVVCHKQSYLDEFKYAVHNIATDIRDGVRLTKVVEIILMKNGLLSQLRTPAISRLQKIHNVQVALNALKEANFVIMGDITATDIADGHREKTLSLLWQLIHVFRAPLFVKAANVIQTWWRKKYSVIVEKRKQEEELRQRLNNAASTIQMWWRRIQYNRMVEFKMRQITYATITIQKYFRRWLCRSRFLKMKSNVLRIEDWYLGVKAIRVARNILNTYRLKREEQRCKAATKIQAHVRRWICVKHFRLIVNKIICLQSIVRCFLTRNRYLRLKKSVLYIQEKYKGKLLMKEQMKKLAVKIKSIVAIQSYYRMARQRKLFLGYKNAVRTIENHYSALNKMRKERTNYLLLIKATLKVQSIYRGKKCRTEYIRCRNLIIYVQRKVRAQQNMLKERKKYLMTRKAILTIQSYIRSYLAMKKARNAYLIQRKSAIMIQNYFRTCKIAKARRENYTQLRSAVIKLQSRYRSLLKMRQERNHFIKLKNATIALQRHYRALILMRECKNKYQTLRKAAIFIQERYKALKQMREKRSEYLKIKLSCIIIQNRFRAYLLGKIERKKYVKLRENVIKIQNWYRSCKKSKEIKHQYEKTKQACVTIQKRYKAYLISRTVRHEFIRVKTATTYIQKYYRNYLISKRIRQEFITLKAATITIQRFYRSYIETNKQRERYLRLKLAVLLIQSYYKSYKETQRIKQEYNELRAVSINIQRKFRAMLAMKRERERFLKMKHLVIVVQRRYRALVAMRLQRWSYLELRSAVIVVQKRFKAQMLMKKKRAEYLTLIESCKKIQRFYRAYRAGKEQRYSYLLLKNVTIRVQQKYKALLAMKKTRTNYLLLRSSIVVIQQRFRAYKLMIKERQKYRNLLQAIVNIQRYYRSYILCKKATQEYLEMKSAAIVIQKYYRSVIEMRKIRNNYRKLLDTVRFVQQHIRAKNAIREARREIAASKIQKWYISKKLRNKCRSEYLETRKRVIMIQSVFRMHIKRKQYQELKRATITIQACYRLFKLARVQRQNYIAIRTAVIKLQAFVRSHIQRKRFLKIRSAALVIQALYRLKRHKVLMKQKREVAALCIQKNIRRYLVRKWYKSYKEHVKFIQLLWRGKLVTRLIRWEFLQKRRTIIKLQAIARGYLVRKNVQLQKETLQKLKEEQKQNWAASKIQALFRGHRARVKIEDRCVHVLRRRWRDGALKSTQQSLKERNEEVMDVLGNMSDIETVIRAFRSLELLTEVFPMMYNNNALSIVRRVYVYMSVTNRSISSIEVLKSAASVLVNLTRYKITGPKIYERDRIPPVLKFMWRFSNSEIHLFCILSTYLWLFSKYDGIKEDLTQFLHIPENHKILVTIKGNVDRMKRMANNVTKNRFHTPQPSKFISHTSNHSFRDSMNHSICNTSNIAHMRNVLLPALEPDYGIVRADKPRYFEDAQQAINCLFKTYKL